MRPDSAIQVRADQVQPGDQLWIEGDTWGTVFHAYDSHADYVLIDNNGGASICRRPSELVWVVRAPAVHDIVVKLTEDQIRERAQWHQMSAPGSAVQEKLEQACAEWVQQQETTS